MINILLYLPLSILFTFLIFWASKYSPDRVFLDYGEKGNANLYKDFLSSKKYIFIILFVIIFITSIVWQKTSILYGIFIGLITAILLFIALSDIKYQIIPDEALILLLVFSVYFFIEKTFEKNIKWSIIAFISVYIIYFIVTALVRVIKKDNKVNAFGFGDVKLFSVISILFGGKGTIIIFILTMLLAGIYFSILMAFKKLKANQMAALGQYIVTSSIIYICFTNQINSLVDIYINLF